MTMKQEVCKRNMCDLDKERNENMAIDIQKMEEDFNNFFNKYKNCDFEGATDEEDYVADADEILARYEGLVMSEEEKCALSRHCVLLGCKIMMYTDNINGPKYYHKAIGLQPDSYDVHWGYYTTLEEIVENEEYATPELIQDAIDCLTFCIDYCDTPELCEQYCVRNRYVDLGRVYMAAGEFVKAKECAEKSLAIEFTEFADKLLKRAEKLVQMKEDKDDFYKNTFCDKRC